MFELRDYQSQALAVQAAWAEGINCPVVVIYRKDA